jgi:hypothetical protein
METAMKNITFLVIILLLLSSCVPVVEKTGSISNCRQTVDAISALTAGLDIPANLQSSDPVKKGGEFDVMQYFNVLDHLAMRPGYVLDYIYHFDGMGGLPIMYVRHASQPPYASESDLATAGETSSYLDYIQIDDTPESYFQLALLSVMGSQFYLYWHANYNDSQIICARVDVPDVVTGLDGDFGYPISLIGRIRTAFLRNVGPFVELGVQSAKVRLITFTRWGGFYQQIFTISRSSPNTIQGVQENNLVPYDCGVMY